MKKVIVALFILSQLPGCNTNTSNKNTEQILKVNDVANVTKADTLTTDISTLNFTDKNGQKQGTWQTYLKGRLWKKDNYLHNKLHGKCYEYLADGTVMETNYENGIRHGYFLQYDKDSAFANFVTYWENGKSIWSAFPWELNSYLVPIKGFITEKDTVRIAVPYNSGKLMYKGTVISKKGSNAKAIGVHMAYYETGRLKSIINYNTDTIKVFSVYGKLINEASIKEWRGKHL